MRSISKLFKSQNFNTENEYYYLTKELMEHNQLLNAIKTKYQLNGTLHIADNVLKHFSTNQLYDMFITNQWPQFNLFHLENISPFGSFQFNKYGDVWYVFPNKEKQKMNIVSQYVMNDTHLMIWKNKQGDFELGMTDIFYSEITFHKNLYCTRQPLPSEYDFNSFGNQMEEDSDESSDDEMSSSDCSSFDDDDEKNSSYSVSLSNEDDKYSNPNNILVAYGVSDKTTIKKKNYVGWKRGTYALHTDDGKCYSGSGYYPTDAVRSWIKYEDTIGCGFNPKTHTVFFTCNGELVFDCDYQPTNAYFAMTIETVEGIEINGGNKSFKYNPYC